MFDIAHYYAILSTFAGVFNISLRCVGKYRMRYSEIVREETAQQAVYRASQKRSDAWRRYQDSQSEVKERKRAAGQAPNVEQRQDRRAAAERDGAATRLKYQRALSRAREKTTDALAK